MSGAAAATPVAGVVVGGGAYATGTNAGLTLQSILHGLFGFYLPIEIAAPIEFGLVAAFSGFIHWAIRRKTATPPKDPLP